MWSFLEIDDSLHSLDSYSGYIFMFKRMRGLKVSETHNICMFKRISSCEL